MDKKIIENKSNELLKRKEVKIIVKSNKNLSKKEASELVADEFKAPEECIVIKNIMGKFGRDTFLISTFIYSSKEDKERIEKKSKKEREEKKPEEKKE